MEQRIAYGHRKANELLQSLERPDHLHLRFFTHRIKPQPQSVEY